MIIMMILKNDLFSILNVMETFRIESTTCSIPSWYDND